MQSNFSRPGQASKGGPIRSKLCKSADRPALWPALPGLQRGLLSKLLVVLMDGMKASGRL